MQLTVTVVTSAEPTVPVPFATVQVWDGPLGLASDGDRVTRSAQQGGGEGEGAVRGDREVVSAVVAEHEAAPGEAADRSADVIPRQRIGDAAHPDGGDVRAPDGPRAARHRAGLPGGLHQDRDRIAVAAGQSGGEVKGTIAADRQVVGAIVLEHQPASGEAADRAAHRVRGRRVGDAAHGDGGDVRASDDPRAVRHRAGLPGGLRQDRDRVAAPASEHRGEDERTTCGDREVVSAVVAEHQPGPGQSGDRPADGVAGRWIRRAGDGDAGDVRRAHRARATGEGAGLSRGLGPDGDRIAIAGHQRCGEGEGPAARDREVVSAVVAQHESWPGEPTHRPAHREHRHRVGDAVDRSPPSRPRSRRCQPRSSRYRSATGHWAGRRR